MVYSSSEESTVCPLTKLIDQTIAVSCIMMEATNRIQSWSGYSAKQLRPFIYSLQVNCTFTEIFQEVVRPVFANFCQGLTRCWQFVRVKRWGD